MISSFDGVSAEYGLDQDDIGEDDADNGTPLPVFASAIDASVDSTDNVNATKLQDSEVEAADTTDNAGALKARRLAKDKFVAIDSNNVADIAFTDGGQFRPSRRIQQQTARDYAEEHDIDEESRKETAADDIMNTC
ncbi:hypothetical protein SBRCBS47491_004638 [Sporothrix bragantina]|uniref:Uncharacterized protein n=1 Tax=Sporothrix bragantina TaxID=671064 RepID=A0ABP0BQQ3_9PEZI